MNVWRPICYGYFSVGMEAYSRERSSNSSTAGSLSPPAVSCSIPFFPTTEKRVPIMSPSAICAARRKWLGSSGTWKGGTLIAKSPFAISP